MAQFFGVILLKDLKKSNEIDLMLSTTSDRLDEIALINNDFANYVYNVILDNPRHVVFMGDYGYNAIEDGTGENIDKSKAPEIFLDNKDGILTDIYDQLHDIDDNDEFNPDIKNVSNTSMNISGGYLINKTNNVYIDIDQYIKDVNISRIENPRPINYEEDNNEIANPLPLLTAIGNGYGIGDYYDNSINYNLTGSWALDEIYFTYDKSKTKSLKLEKIIFEFEELEME